MGFLRERENYPDIVVGPYEDQHTKAVYAEACFTSGSITISSRTKTLSYDVDVYASVEAFEQGGEPVAIGAVRRFVTQDTTPSYDEVIAANGQLVGGVLQALNQIEAELRGGE